MLLFATCCGYLHLMCDHDATNLKGGHRSFEHWAAGSMDSETSDCPEVCLFLALHSQETLVCLSGYFGNISGLSL